MHVFQIIIQSTFYFRPRLLAVMFLGIASGLPLLLVGATLGAWLQESGLSKGDIGLFALVALPYSFNFLWAPLIDRLTLPLLTRRFGRRRGWLLLIQASIAITLSVMAHLAPSLELGMVAVTSVLLAFFSASQDVVIDAYRTEYLQEEEYAAGAAMAVFGYRLGMLMAGAGALAVADIASWHLAYLVMVAVMSAAFVVTLFLPEPDSPQPGLSDRGKSWLHDTFLSPFRDFSMRHKSWGCILLLVFCYRLPDGLIGFLTTPFFLDIGFSKTEIATIAKLYGFGATLLGMFLGGLLVPYLGMLRAMRYFLFLQIFTNLTYLLLSEAGPDPVFLMISIACDNLSGGMITTVAVAYIMSLCNPLFTATQYALLSSLASLASKSLASGAGYIAEAIGWSGLFLVSAVAGIPALILLWMKATSLLRHQTATDE